MPDIYLHSFPCGFSKAVEQVEGERVFRDAQAAALGLLIDSYFCNAGDDDDTIEEISKMFDKIGAAVGFSISYDFDLHNPDTDLSNDAFTVQDLRI